MKLIKVVFAMLTGLLLATSSGILLASQPNFHWELELSFYIGGAVLTVGMLAAIFDDVTL